MRAFGSKLPIAAAVAVLFAGVAQPGLAADLVPPPGYYAEAGHGGVSKPCDPAPRPFTGPLDFPSKYDGSDASRDTLNEASDARYEAMTQPISDMEKGATRLVDRYMQDGSPQTLHCVLGWYGAWADAGALLGPAMDHTGRSERKWALASLSGAWVRLHFSRSRPLAVDPQEAARIEAWLGRIANQITREWTSGDPVSKINNHYYWAAWSVMATAIVTDRHDLFDWATDMYGAFARQVDADGFLPNELKRATRAAGYQVYAVTPVAMLAAFGKANHLDLAGEGGNALQRAAERAVTAYDDPTPFEARTGAKQVMDGVDEQQTKLAWLEPYCWTVRCTGVVDAKLRPLRDTRLGGNVTDIYAVSPPRSNPAR